MNKFAIICGRCVAIKDFGEILKGDVGGLVSPGCLSQEGECWVHDGAQVYGNATVSGNAQIFGNAKVYGNARVYGNAEVSGRATVSGDAEVFGFATVRGNATVFGSAVVCDHARVRLNATVTGYANSRANVTKDLSGRAIVFNGLGWLVTITDDHIKIGCVCKSKEWWASASDSTISKLAIGAISFWKTNKEEILCCSQK